MMRVLLIILATAFSALVGCASLSQSECLNSPHHTLVYPGRDWGYHCRAARNECEKGFIQDKHGREECEANSLCKYEPANCFCPEDMHCICGGGPPANCGLKES